MKGKEIGHDHLLWSLLQKEGNPTYEKKGVLVMKMFYTNKNEKGKWWNKGDSK